MPNWCNNALEIQCHSDKAGDVFDSLLDGSLMNRTSEIEYKMRKIFLAGLSGLLVPHISITHELIIAVTRLNKALSNVNRRTDDQSAAYSQFLALLVSGTIWLDNYELLESIYRRTGVGSMCWGDIPKRYRKAMKPFWKICSFDYFNGKRDISRWWSQSNDLINDAKISHIDMRILTPKPIRVAVNGFNGGMLEKTESGYDYNQIVYGSKSSIISVARGETNQNYIFDTPWSPAITLTSLIPEFVALRLGIDTDVTDPEDIISCNLYYYESGIGFQGINDSRWELVDYHDEETDEYIDGLSPEIEAAFS